MTDRDAETVKRLHAVRGARVVEERGARHHGGPKHNAISRRQCECVAFDPAQQLEREVRQQGLRVLLVGYKMTDSGHSLSNDDYGQCTHSNLACSKEDLPELLFLLSADRCFENESKSA